MLLAIQITEWCVVQYVIARLSIWFRLMITITFLHGTSNVHVLGRRLLASVYRIQVSYWEAFCKDIWTQKDRKFILIIGHSHHRSSSLSWLRQVSADMPVTCMPNIAFITRFDSVRRHLVDRTLVRCKILRRNPIEDEAISGFRGQKSVPE